MEAANGLIDDAAEATGNPFALSWALLAYGGAVQDADPARSLATLRRGLVIAQDSGNRFVESTRTYRCQWGVDIEETFLHLAGAPPQARQVPDNCAINADEKAIAVPGT